MNKEQLLALLKEDAGVITPNNRLSNDLLLDFLQAYPQFVQEKPQCMPYSVFLGEWFQQLCHQQTQVHHPLLLSAQQSRHLWRQILEGDEMPVNTGLLTAVEEAWTRCNLWLVDFKNPCFNWTPQTKQFQLWSLRFLETLNALNAITVDQLGAYLCSQNARGSHKKLIWACFDDYTPVQKRIKDYLLAQQTQIFHYDIAARESQVSLYAANNEEEELAQLFAWLKEQIKEGKTRIGVVVPDLESKASLLQRKLQAIVPPTEFNLSLGKALIHYPLVAHAIHWLFLDGEMLSVTQARLLLTSPFLAYSQAEHFARSQLLEQSNVLKEYDFNHKSFIKELQTTTPRLAKMLQNLSPYPEKASIQAWIQLFYKRLKILGFPGEISLNSENYQCYQRFVTLLEDFQQLALITQNLEQSKALSIFKELAASTIFQPRKTMKPLQILGLLEASGCSFDGVWIMSLTDQCLPKNVKFSPFIPLSLQKELQMPHADANKELDLAKKTLKRLQHASPLCIVSYPLFKGDEPNRASPLIANLREYSPLAPKIASPKSKLMAFPEDYQRPLLPEEKIRGGTSLLANQAKCPFKAFAAHRLHVHAANEACEGLNPKERGQLIHKVMELLWLNLKTQQHLLQLDEYTLASQIDTVVEQALKLSFQQKSSTFSSLSQEIEGEGLKLLVQASLAWERQRNAFEVEKVEQTFTIHLAGLEFTLRVDRLDKVENDQKWVIDYKTTLPQTLPWNEERPQEPQLLLYALLDENINTLLFTQLKAGQFQPKGLSEEKHTLDGLASLKKNQTWTGLRQHWTKQLNELAQEFVQGHCPPQPRTLSTCQHCHYQNLCRFTQKKRLTAI